MNKVSDLRDLCQLWADDVVALEEQGRIDRVTADALARFARSFFTGLVSAALSSPFLREKPRVLTEKKAWSKASVKPKRKIKRKPKA